MKAKRHTRPLWRRVLRRMVRWGAVAVVLALVAFVIAYAMSDNDCGEAKAAPAHPMQAVVHCDYGAPEVLKLEAVEKPVPDDDQLLVRVRAASVNPLDWHYIRGTPYLMRIDGGLRKPKSTRVGVDFAGTVEAVGKNVTGFKPGDDVFGGRSGAFAEYVAVRADRAVVHKPASVSFEQAAGVPIAGLTALQGLRDRGKLQPGQKVLINGASGGVGTFAVQVAKSMGAEVTGVCSTRNVEMVRSLGADHVVDYTQEDFTRGTTRYDVILDNVGNRALSECRRVLAPEGRYVLIGGGGPNDHRIVGPLGKVLHAVALSKFVDQELGIFISSMSKDDLAELARMMEAGKVTPVIDRRYPLSAVAEAVAYVETGRARGKVILVAE